MGTELNGRLTRHLIKVYMQNEIKIHQELWLLVGLIEVNRSEFIGLLSFRNQSRFLCL